MKIVSAEIAKITPIQILPEETPVLQIHAITLSRNCYQMEDVNYADTILIQIPMERAASKILATPMKKLKDSEPVGGKL